VLELLDRYLDAGFPDAAFAAARSSVGGMLTWIAATWWVCSRVEDETGDQGRPLAVLAAIPTAAFASVMMLGFSLASATPSPASKDAAVWVELFGVAAVPAACLPVAYCAHRYFPARLRTPLAVYGCHAVAVPYAWLVFCLVS